MAAAAAPSAAGAEASGADVAKASEVCTHPSGAAEVEEERKMKSKKSQEIRQNSRVDKTQVKKNPLEKQMQLLDVYTTDINHCE